jgi:hypothetical protein
MAFFAYSTQLICTQRNESASWSPHVLNDHASAAGWTRCIGIKGNLLSRGRVHVQ